MPLEVPSPHAVVDVRLEDGCVVPVRRHGNPAGTRIVMAHGNGFAADAYLPFWRLLLDDFDVVVFDFRNHGRSGTSGLQRHVYAQLVRDFDRVVAAIAEGFGAVPTVGAFHSLSARVASKHAVEVGWTWSALALFDPSSVPPRGHPFHMLMADHSRKLARWALGRRRRFDTPAELAAEYAGLRAAAHWIAGTHDLLAGSVLRPDPDGSAWTLVCAPEAEASLYAEAPDLELWPEASRFGGPVLLVGADPSVAHPAPTAFANKALGRENAYDYLAVPGTGHFLQLEEPEACAGVLRDFVARHGLASRP